MSDVQEPLSWGKSTATAAVLEQLVVERLLPMNHNSERPAWIPPRPEETEPSPPDGYIVSLVRLHERGFGVPVGRFITSMNKSLVAIASQQLAQMAKNFFYPGTLVAI